jgi:polysaccharide pyruvyl transferase WcaK-like protein
LTAKIHFIHVGNMNNKGTQALLSSDVSLLKEIVKDDIFISVSTTDMEGVKRLGLSIDAVLPTILDVPYEKADRLTRRLRISRRSKKYKGFAVGAFLLFLAQTTFALMSVILRKSRLPVFYRKELMKSVSESDLVISCSDENFKESASLLPLNVYWIFTWWSMLFERTIEIMVAKSLGKSVVMFPNSVGPFRTFVGRFLSRLALSNCETVIIRDPISYAIVNSIGINCQKFLTSDMALLYKPKAKASHEIVNHPVIGVCPGVYSFSISTEQIERYVIDQAEALDAAIEKYGFHVFFLPHYISGFEYDDFEISKLISENMENKRQVSILKIDSLEEFKLLINQMDLLISSKMHPAVLAASGYVPAISIVYDHKQTGFFKDLELSEYAVRLQDTSGKTLFSKIVSAWSEKEKIKALLMAHVPKMQDRIREDVIKAIEPFVDCQ